MSSADVDRYYETNTRWFLRFGRTGGIGAIHREVWGDGVSTVTEAVDHVHHLILERLPDGARVLDLGCGVGGSLCRLAQLSAGIEGCGITISATQARLATERAAALGLDGLAFTQGDFHALPAELGAFRGAYAIEAWAHARDPDAFLESVAARLEPGGVLLLIDDFAEPGGGPRADRARATFAEGWSLGCLVSASEAAERAAAHGFTLEEDLDLTAQLNLWRPRDHAIAALVTALGPLPIRHPYWASLKGGHALQRCLTARWVTYRLLRFRRE